MSHALTAAHWVVALGIGRAPLLGMVDGCLHRAVTVATDRQMVVGQHIGVIYLTNHLEGRPPAGDHLLRRQVDDPKDTGAPAFQISRVRGPMDLQRR